MACWAISIRNISARQPYNHLSDASISSWRLIRRHHVSAAMKTQLGGGGARRANPHGWRSAKWRHQSSSARSKATSINENQALKARSNQASPLASCAKMAETHSGILIFDIFSTRKRAAGVWLASSSLASALARIIKRHRRSISFAARQNQPCVVRGKRVVSSCSGSNKQKAAAKKKAAKTAYQRQTNAKIRRRRRWRRIMA